MTVAHPAPFSSPARAGCATVITGRGSGSPAVTALCSAPSLLQPAHEAPPQSTPLQRPPIGANQPRRRANWPFDRGCHPPKLRQAPSSPSTGARSAPLLLLPRASTSQSRSTTCRDASSPEEEGPRRPRRRPLGFTWPVGHKPLCAALWPLESAQGPCGTSSPPRGRRRALLGREQQVRRAPLFFPAKDFIGGFD
jgi:hypothetical protein